MDQVKVVFVGCNPSLKNEDPNVPFKGTKSGVTLEAWRIALGLDESQCSYINLIKFATKNQSKLKIKDIDIEQFRFNMGVKLIAATHGEEKGLSMIISAMQDAGKLDPQKLVPNTKEEVAAHREELKTTPMPKVILLGTMASDGMKLVNPKIPTFELPHPSGLNRKCNDKVYMAKTLEECKAWIYKEEE